MKRKWKGLLAVFLAVMLMATCSVAGAVDGEVIGNPDEIEELPLAKTADLRLDEDYRATVTLTMPSYAELLETDVVFVLDKSTSADVRNAALDMLKALRSQVQETNAIVKVGVVVYNRQANASENLMDIQKEYDEIEEWMGQEPSSGTNAHAGMLAGKALLDSGAAAPHRKYLIFVSDGITYLFDNNGTASTIVVAQYADNPDFPPKYCLTAEAWDVKYKGKKGNQTTIKEIMRIDDNNTAVAEFLEMIGEKVKSDNGKYDVGAPLNLGSKEEANDIGDRKEYILKANTNLSTEDFSRMRGDDANDHAIATEKSLYLTNEVYKQAVAAGYNCYAYNTYNKTYYQYGDEFMNYLSGGKKVDFSSIQNDLCHLYGAGTVVTDVMGVGTNDDKTTNYDFNFLPETVMLQCGKVDADGKMIEGQYATYKVAYRIKNGDGSTTYFFAPDGSVNNDGVYDFELTYYPEGSGERTEYYTLTFRRKINLGEQLKVIYQVELDGEHREEDPGLYKGLKTNNEASILPKDSEGNQSENPQDFPNPETSYENIGVVKKWAGDNDSAVRPSGLTIALVNKEDGKTKGEIELNQDNDWTGKFLNIREGDYPDERFSMANYNGKTEYDSNKRIYTITNTYDAPAPVYDYTTVTITKIWDDNGYGGRPGSIKVKLGVENDPNYEGYTVKLSKDNPNVRIDGNTWTWSATIIDRNYYAEELYVDGYASKVEEVQPNQFVITNTYMPATGDDTPVTRYLLMLGGAALLIAAACVLRARKKA